MKAFLRWLLTLILILTAFAMLLMTPVGSQVTLSIAKKIIPGKLTYRQFSGILLGQMTFEQLDYQHHNLHLNIQELQLDWRPLSLLHGLLDIKTLAIKHMLLITPETQQPQTSFLNFSLPTPKPLKLPLPLKIADGNLQDVRFGHSPSQWLVHIQQGNINGIAKPDDLDLHIKVQLQRPQIASISMQLFGSLAHYELQLRIQNSTSNWLLYGKGTPQSIRLTTAHSKLFMGDLSGQFIINWQQQWNWQVQLVAKSLHLRQLNANLPQNINMTFNSNGSMLQNHPQLSWHAHINTLHNHIYTDGQLLQSWQANWNIDIKQLSELVTNSSGSIRSQGSLQGKWPNLITQGQLNGQNLRWQNNTAQHLTATWQADLSQQNNSNITVAAQQIQVLGKKAQSFNFSTRGTLKQHHIEAKLIEPSDQIAASMNGSLQAGIWRAAIAQLNIQSTGFGNWQLQKSANLALSTNNIQLSPLCLTTDKQANFCLALDKQQQKWHVMINSVFNLDQFSNPIFTNIVQLHIPASLHMDIVGNNNQITAATSHLLLKSGSITTHHKGKLLTIGFQGAELTNTLSPQNMITHLQLQLDKQNSLVAELHFPQYSIQKLITQQQPINGFITVDVKDTTVIANVLPDVFTINGALQGKWLINGTLKQPQLSGNMTLAHAKYSIPPIFVVVPLDNIKLTATSTKSLLNYHLNAVSTGRPVTATGTIDLIHLPLAITAHIETDNLLAINTKEYTAYGTSKIDISTKGFDVQVTGSVNIPQALIKPVDIKGIITLPTDDLIIIGGEQTVTPSPIRLSLNLNVTLGDKILLNSMGLTGVLRGSLLVTHNPQEAFLGTGNITILNGQYDILGRTLTVSRHSSVIYRRSPLDNPNLNVQIFKKTSVDDTTLLDLDINSIKVGVNITGTASAPQMAFFSSPATLPQNQILSYLVLGNTSATASPATANLLLQALNSIRHTNQQASPSIATRIKQGLGFTELGVETEASLTPLGEPTNKQTTYVVLGKRITPKLSARYKVDPLSSISIFTLYYILTKHVRIQTEKSNLGTGADILYTIEKKSKHAVNHDGKEGTNATD